jgi:hypothetical protein
LEWRKRLTILQVASAATLANKLGGRSVVPWLLEDNMVSTRYQGICPKAWNLKSGGQTAIFVSTTLSLKCRLFLENVMHATTCRFTGEEIVTSMIEIGNCDFFACSHTLNYSAFVNTLNYTLLSSTYSKKRKKKGKIYR